MYYILVVQRLCFAPESTDRDLNYSIKICFRVYASLILGPFKSTIWTVGFKYRHLSYKYNQE